MTRSSNLSQLYFIVHTPFSNGAMALRPGALQHNCAIAAQRFVPLLQNLGEVIEIADAATDIAAIARKTRKKGLQPLLISFAPPHLLPALKPCPVLAVFAWAYDTIPNEAWGNNPRNDWRNELQACVGAITHSRHALQAIEAATSNSLTATPVAAASIPVPVPQVFFDLFDGAYEYLQHQWALQFNGVTLDSLALGLDNDIHGSDVAYESTPQHCIFSGIVYCLVVDPIDKSKNWLDSMWAFAFAFRDNPQATLIIKLSHHDTVRVCSVVHYEMRKLAPFKCRIVAIAAWLDAQEFQQLVKASTYVVNSARAEAQGLTLLEFMAAGKPAITPAHTALADFIDEDAAFVVASSREWTYWPHDPRMMLRTHRYRIDWSSYEAALLRSYAIASGDTPRYRTMSLRAHNAALAHCAPIHIAQQLQDYLDTVLAVLAQHGPQDLAALEPTPIGALKQSLKRLLARWR